MRSNENTVSHVEAEILGFEPALQRRRDREQFFRLHSEWVNPYRDGIDGLWIGPIAAEVIPFSSPKAMVGGH